MTTPEEDNKIIENNSETEAPENPPADQTIPDSAIISEDVQAAEPSKTDPVVPEPDFDFSRMEDDVAAFRRELEAIPLPSAEDAPEIELLSTPDSQLRRRRRTTRPAEIKNDQEEQIETLSQRAIANLDFFLFILLSGVIIGLGYILDSPAILILGVVIVPILSPWMGTALASATGDYRLFRQTFGGMLSAFVFIFLTSLIAGFLLRFIQPLTSSQAFYHSRLWWPDLLMLVLGTATLMIGFIQSDEKPVIPSLLVAYELFLPIGAAGFGAASGIKGLWPESGLVFLVHLTISIVTAVLIFIYLNYRPIELRGYSLSAIILLVGSIIVVSFSGIGRMSNIKGQEIYATPDLAKTIALFPTSIPEFSVTPQPIKQIPATMIINTAVPTVIVPTFSPTPTVIPSATVIPTPVFGRIKSSASDGITIKDKPGGLGFTTAQNGYLVEILTDPPVFKNGIIWIHVIVKSPSRDITGWIQSILVQTVTPTVSP